MEPLTEPPMELPMEPLVRWVERQYRHSAAAMMRSVSAVGIVKKRPGFAQIGSTAERLHRRLARARRL